MKYLKLIITGLLTIIGVMLLSWNSFVHEHLFNGFEIHAEKGTAELFKDVEFIGTNSYGQSFSHVNGNDFHSSDVNPIARIDLHLGNRSRKEDELRATYPEMFRGMYDSSQYFENEDYYILVNNPHEAKYEDGKTVTPIGVRILNKQTGDIEDLVIPRQTSNDYTYFDILSLHYDGSDLYIITDNSVYEYDEKTDTENEYTELILIHYNTDERALVDTVTSQRYSGRVIIFQYDFPAMASKYLVTFLDNDQDQYFIIEANFTEKTFEEVKRPDGFDQFTIYQNDQLAVLIKDDGDYSQLTAIPYQNGSFGKEYTMDLNFQIDIIQNAEKEFKPYAFNPGQPNIPRYSLIDDKLFVYQVNFNETKSEPYQVHNALTGEMLGKGTLEIKEARQNDQPGSDYSLNQNLIKYYPK